MDCCSKMRFRDRMLSLIDCSSSLRWCAEVTPWSTGCFPLLGGNGVGREVDDSRTVIRELLFGLHGTQTPGYELTWKSCFFIGSLV